MVTKPKGRAGRTVPGWRFASLGLAWLTFFCLVLPAKSSAQEREPAFKDNLYDVVIRGHLAWIVGYYGTILRSQDRGLTWELQPSGTSEALFRASFADANQGWAVGSYGTILHTRNSGKSWQKQKSPLDDNLLGLQFINEQNGWAVGNRGIILATEDGGATWHHRGLGGDVILNDVHFLNAKQGWVIGEFGRIYRTQDGGRSWLKQKSPIEVSFNSGDSRNLFRLLFTNNHAWAFGLDGTILTIQNGGPWRIDRSNGAAPPNTNRNHLFAATTLGGKKWTVGERGIVLVSEAGENHWRSVDLKAPLLTLNGIAAGNDGLGLIVGNRGLILRTNDGGNRWKQITVGPITKGVPARAIR